MTSRALRSLLLAPLLAVAVSLPAAAAGASVRYLTPGTHAGAAAASIAELAQPRAGHGAAHAEAGPQGAGWADYDGRHIDLASSWGSAHACWASQQNGTQCYASAAAMSEATGIGLPAFAAPSGSIAGSGETGATPGSGTGSSGTSGPTTAETGVARPLSESCGSGQALYLYSGEDFSGKVLGISQANVWVDLASYGFADEMSSWINDSSCPAMGEHTLGGNYLEMGSHNSSSYVGATWNHQVVWVCLEG